MERIRDLALKHGKKHQQFLLYTLIGLSGVVLDYILFALGTSVFGVGVVTANFVAISAGILNNFWLNTKYNFKTTDHLLKRFGLFYAVGALGIAISEVLIVLFHYGFDMNALWAKLLTLPFVLVFQFFLNRRFSFGNVSDTEKRLKKMFFHWPFYIVLMAYAASSLLLVAVIPSFNEYSVKGGPDEAIHYRFNVEYIMKHHSLPVGGRDDLEAYGACRDNDIGIIPCVYSYNTYPGPNYILGAITATIFGSGKSISPEIAARFSSFGMGLAFVIFSYAAVYAILKRRLFATVMVAAVAFIPQLLFTNSYTNMDAHSLAISAFLGYTLVKFLQRPRSRKWQILWAVALCGLLPISKYNYFVLGFAGVLFTLYVFFKNKFSRKEILRFSLYAFVSFMVLASFWYIRNLILYHDIMGQSFVVQEMAKHHALGRGYNFAWPGINILIHVNFFEILFRSFYFGFGLMNFFLAEYDYKIVMMVLIACASIYAFNVFQPVAALKENRRLLLATGLWIVVALGTLFIILYNSLHYDFQPQGRYMYPILVPSLLLLAYAIKQDTRQRIVAFLLLASTVYILIESALLFIKVYF